MSIDFQSIETPSTSSEEDKNEDEIININEEYKNNNNNKFNCMENLEPRYHNWHSGSTDMTSIDISPVTSVLSHYESPGKWLNINTTRPGVNHHYINGSALLENLLKQKSIFNCELRPKCNNDDNDELGANDLMINDDTELETNIWMDPDTELEMNNLMSNNDEKHIDYNHNRIINEITYSNKYPLSMHNRIYVNGSTNYYHNPRHPIMNPNHSNVKTILPLNTIVNKCYDLL